MCAHVDIAQSCLFVCTKRQFAATILLRAIMQVSVQIPFQMVLSIHGFLAEGAALAVVQLLQTQVCR